MNRFEKEALSKEKRRNLEEALEEDFVLVHIDCQAEGVSLPSHLMENQTVTLKLSYRFQGQVLVSEQGVEANLLFGANYFTCLFPLTAIWGITTKSGKNLIWPSSTPESILSALNSQESSEETREQPEIPKAAGKMEQKRPQLKRIK